MLAPNDRTLLLEALRPPPGLRLDLAVSTTYSLDLMALLVVPLAFTFFDWEGEDGQPTRDPNALLEAIRRHVDRIHVFCQAGQISVPNTYRMLFSYLESSVHEVRTDKQDGVFHPKVWMLRYAADDESPQYRLLCASRNLTFDRSWDTLLVLDGVVSKKHEKENEPLARFLRALPAMSVQALSEAAENSVMKLADEVGRVEFQLPENVEEIYFWPLGLPDEQDTWPFPEQADRGLVISPFLADSTLNRLKISGEQALISRVDTLAALGAKQLTNYETFVFNDGADLVMEDGVDTESFMNTANELSGLHAKLFAFDAGGVARVWTGSANATNAAFHNNVEFLVEMRGRSQHMGVEVILCPSQKGINVLRDLLEPFTPDDESVSDLSQQKLDQTLAVLRRFMVDLKLEVHAELADADHYNLKLISTSKPEMPEREFELRCWPLSLKQEAGAQYFSTDYDKQLLFPSLSFEGLTTFFAFELQVVIDRKTGVSRFVLNLPAKGFPSNRRQHLLRYMLKDRDQVIRYLFLLLGDDGTLSLSDFSGSSRYIGGSSVSGKFCAGIPMLEALVKALDGSPEKLDEIASFLTELRSTEEGQALLPEEFDQIWTPLCNAREELARNGR